MAAKKKSEIKKTSRRRGRPPKKKAVKPVELNADKSLKPTPAEEKKPKRLTYLYAVGRRKEAIARVRYHSHGEGRILVNNKPVELYFPLFQLRNLIEHPFQVIGNKPPGNFTAKVMGGGIRGQAESVRLGIARILVKLDGNCRSLLKKAGLLRRDDRIKERKKYGLKRARRAPQWQKR
jgi:small subunit ribosomal protein S9